MISVATLLKETIKEFIETAESIRSYPKEYSTNLYGKILATLFYEPSTRTRLSFESAMLRLGGKVISTESASQFSSAIKGESLEDTIRVVSSYCDGIVLRHPEVGAAERAKKVCPIPLINAGDGSGEHPTQALLDVYTIWREKGKIEGLHYAIAGDLKYGRTVHSLVQLLSLYPDVRITFISPQELAIPSYLLELMGKRGVEYREMHSMYGGLQEKPDVIYLTRVQTERMTKVSEVPLFGKYELDMLKKDCIIMHPLPRVTELAREVDEDERAVYFRQAENGLWMRAAILYRLLR